MVNHRFKLRSPDSIPRHTPDDLAEMIWTKYLRPVKDREHEGYDIPTTFTGPTGTGKSEAALATIMALNLKSGASFSVSEQIVYDKKQFVKAILTLPRYHAILVDEAISVLFSRQENVDAIKYMNAVRSKNLAIFYAIPNFTDMDAKARLGNIRYWIDIERPGFGLEFLPQRVRTTRPQSNDPWAEWAFREVRLGKAKIEAHPCFQGYYVWDKVPAKLRNDYVSWKNKNALISIGEEEERKKSKNTVEDFIAWLELDGSLPRGLKLRASEYLEVDSKTITVRVRNILKAKPEESI